ncbi:MAG: VCBS repeat-containing protein, partial [Polyangiaceae bacterium]|nr:VCBS repeat-containing protein [Polyangiaceae bacterium]
IGVDALPRRAATGEGGATIEFNQGDEVVLLQPSVNGGGTSLFGLVSNQRDRPPNAPNPDALLVGLLTLGVNPAESEGGFAVGRFAAPDVGMPCEDIVWAPRELSEVYLLAPCRIEPPLPPSPSPSPSPPSPPVTLPPGVVTVWNEEGIAGRIEPRRVVLPEGARPAAGVERWVFVADVNDDGVSDLAVMTDRGVAFAFGKADGTPPEAALVAGPERVLLAFGDINHDRQPDWVFRDGIVLSELGLPAGVTRELAPAPWSEALVADFNGDGLLDVLAVGPASRSLDYYLSAESGFFNALNVPLEGVASRLAAGDFDGDSVVDVAFALGEESESGQRSVADAVFIAFGGKASSPGVPMRVGELRGVRQIAAGSYVFGGSGLDGADDLGLVGALDEGGGALVALLLGNVARQPLSPLLITGDPSLRPWAVAAGRFVGAEGGARLGLALLAGKLSEVEHPYSFWLSSPSGGVTRFPPPEGDATVGAGSALPPEIGWAPPHGSPTNYAKGELPQMLVGDLNGDGLDEAAALVPQDRGASLVIARAAKGANGAAVLVADQLVEGLPRSILAGFADIDGNGAPDLVLLAPADESPNLTVYWNEGGGFDLGRSTRVEVPEGPVRSWAAPSGPAGSRLFAINAAGVYAIDAGPGRAPRVEPLRELDGGEAIAAGDVTGDGVLDLVVGDGQSLRLVRGEPVLP